MLRSISIMLHARSGFLSFNFSHECPSSGPSPSPWRLLLNRLHPRALGGIGVGLAFNLCLVEVKPADAFTLFSGVDINDSGNNTPLTSFPNSDQARDLFFSRLSSIGTETFEGFTGSAGGTAPPDPFSIGFAVPGGTLDATIVDEGDSARIYNETRWEWGLCHQWVELCSLYGPQGRFGDKFSDQFKPACGRVWLLYNRSQSPEWARSGGQQQ